MMKKIDFYKTITLKNTQVEKNKKVCGVLIRNSPALCGDFL